MKKIYSIILTTVVCLAAFAACTRDYPVGEMARNISLTPAAEQVAAGGQTFDVNVTADGAWVADTPDWITVSPANGEGSRTVKVTVAPNNGGERTDFVQFYSAVGDVSNLSTVLESTPLAEVEVKQAAGEGQGGDNNISIADYLALGANTDPYTITGTITRVTSTKYGNFDLTDETGTIYVYGLLNEDLEAQKCFKDKELALGDVLTVKANTLQFYEKDQIWEIVNAVYVSHTKSLFDLEDDVVTLPKEGADFEVKAVVKGENVKADFDADWITFKGAEKDGENVTLTFTAAENPGSPRAAVISLSTTTAKGESSEVEFTVNQDGSIITATVAEVLAAEDDPLVLYRVTGYISKVNAFNKGRFYITDYTGTIYAFGTRISEDSDSSTDLTPLGLAEGDIVTVIGYKTTYVNGSNRTIEIVGYVEDFKKVEEVTVEEFLAKEVSADNWYRLKGIVTKPTAEETAAGNKFDLAQYGNFRLVDETGRAYVYGVLTGYGQPNNKLFGELGVAEGDEIVIVGNRAAFKGAPQVGKAWYVSHSTPAPVVPVEEGLTISEILAKDVDTDVVSAPSLVTALTSRGFIATDGVKSVYVYAQGTAFNGVAKVGDKVKFSGKRGAYNGFPQISPVTALEVVSSGNEVVFPAERDITSEVETFTANEAVYIALEGKLSKSGNYYNIILDGTTAKQGSLVYPVADLGADALDGKKIKVKGYFNGFSGGGKYINIIAASVTEVQ
ncbi:MAG: hypothetical protein J5693_03660 [Bacteroidales bacterium]|nr:hypothetical protein [Bacteroidales bacterium]